MEGKILNGRYRIDYRVGSGGMAEVYRAYDMKLDRIVAVKALKKEYCEDPQYLRRFTREAQAMLSLSHKNIVSLYDVGSDGDVHYLVLEYVDGCTLREYMDKHGALKPNIAVKIACEVLDGLAHAHENGLVHRDVKPQNVMISSKHEIKLADFGIAKFADSTTRTYEGTEALGSVYYISPEQAKGESVDKQTDIYSLGVMLYEMLTGKPPFTGENAVQIALKHINEEMRPASEINAQVPIALSDVIARAVAKDTSKRYDLATDMKRDLLRALKHPRSRFAKLRNDVIGHAEEEGSKFLRFVKKHIGTVAIVTCVLAIIGIFIAMLLISVSGGRSSAYKSVPNLIGKTLEAAEESAGYKGFEIEIMSFEETENEPGIILEQYPPAQEKAREGTVIKVVVSSMIETVSVPRIIGLNIDEARTELAQRGLVLDEEYIDYAPSDSPEGTVIAQSPTADETAIVGDSVRITVSKQPDTETFKVPDLISCVTAAEAVKALSDAGFENYRIHIITDEDIANAQSAPPVQSNTSGDDGGDEGDADDEAHGMSIGSAFIEIEEIENFADMQLIAQTPVAGTEVLYNTELIDLYVYRSSRGDFIHDFSENFSLKAGDSIVVTLTSDIGEVVIYEAVCTDDIDTVPFRGYYWQGGSYICIFYVNGVVNKELSRQFVQVGT